eukprot:TRINITY_DN9595_c0_g1_i1.p1 TRINITY_DN9595_c0_g1~~TRINITY_DN9595_c0_g1_i1.p1  ORF type:complete len:201 (+),score=17.14 TRINITY_DN9595_c0_g1_i1:239-841(+)
MYQRALAIIKPDAVEKGLADKIISILEDNQLFIIEKKYVLLDEISAEELYQRYQHESFFPDLVSFMCRSPVVVLLLAGTDAIARLDELLGPTDPIQAKQQYPLSIRARFGTNKMENACHGSHLLENSLREISYFFPHQRCYPVPSGTDTRAYIEETVGKTLQEALIDLCKHKPNDPVRHLADYFLSHNPNKPVISFADEP